MAMGTIRPMTDEDQERIAAAARRFIERHGISVHVMADSVETATLQELEGAIDFWAQNQDASERGYYKRLWLAAFRRAVREPRADTYGWGYIGYHID